MILDEENFPIKDVNIQFDNKGSISDVDGYYKIEVESGKNINIVFTHINHKKLQITVNLSENETLEFNPVLSTKFEQISEVVLNTTRREDLKSIQNIPPEKLRDIKGVQPGIENILKTLPGVSINNEMSTQYSVRGGNFDEKLVYVNPTLFVVTLAITGSYLIIVDSVDFGKASIVIKSPVSNS